MIRLIRLLLVLPLLMLSSASVPSIHSLQAAACDTALCPVRIAKVEVDFDRSSGVNNLALGTQLKNFQFYKFCNDSDFSKKVTNAHFGLVRIMIFDFEPAIYWDETSKVGKYDWSALDPALRFIKSIGAEPMITLGGGSKKAGFRLPTGMNGDYAGTGFPRSETFGTYAADIVRHTNIERDFEVKYWEIWNEVYLWDNVPKATANFTRFFNSVQKYMHDVDPSIAIGNDRSNFSQFLDYFVNNAEGVGFLSFHKYDAWGTAQYDSEGYLEDGNLISTASNLGSRTYWNSRLAVYTPTEMQEKWYKIRGERVPVILSETNMNSAWIKGTDPRIQELLGAVWYAEEVRALILSNVQASVFFHLYSRKGVGFGMMDSTMPYAGWYPYWTNYLLGNHLHRGDNIYYSFTPDAGILSTLAWKTESAQLVLLIGKTKQGMRVDITIKPEVASKVIMYKIDRNLNDVQQVELSYSDLHTIMFDGYFVALVRMSAEYATPTTSAHSGIPVPAPTLTMILSSLVSAIRTSVPLPRPNPPEKGALSLAALLIGSKTSRNSPAPLGIIKDEVLVTNCEAPDHLENRLASRQVP